MVSRRTLARRLESVADFADPSPALEQYPTPAEIAAHLLHVAALQGDVSGRTVVDLGAGTGVLALAAASLDPDRVIGLEIDPGAVATARANERRVDPETAVEWVVGDAARAPLCLSDAVVLSNPPFGAQRGREHADRPFLEQASGIGRVSYSIHNAGSRSFVESFAAERGGEVTHAFGVELDVKHRFDFHEEERRTLEAEAYRIRWG